MNRAYAIVEVKDAGSNEQRTISGLATSVVPDRIGDVIVPGGVQVAGDIPLFMYHDATKTVGRARLGKPTADGIPFSATLPKVTEPGALKDRVDEAWQMLRYRLITGVSIGFRVIGDAFERIAGGGTKYHRVEILELSIVPLPMHQLANIETVKAAADIAIQRARVSEPNRNRGSMSMTNYGTLSVNSQLELCVRDGNDFTKSFTLSLSRIMAQRLADELVSFAVTRKAVDGRRELTFPVEVLPEARPATKHAVLRLGKSSGSRPVLRLDGPSGKAHAGVVHLGNAPFKKAGVLYLDEPSTVKKRPVLRLDTKR